MHRPALSSLLFGLLLAPLPASATLQCENILIDGQKFDLKKLGGPHSVVTSQFDSLADSHVNTTYTLDICNNLKKSGKNKHEECPNGTRVCGIRRLIKEEEKVDTVQAVIAIAGSLENVGGSAFDYEATRLKTSDSTSDSQKEGVRLVLKGGKDPLSGPVKERREQKAIIEFLCDPEKTGLEGEWSSEDRYEGDDKNRVRRADGDEKKDGDDKEEEDDGTESGLEHQLKKDDASLIWDSYGRDDKGADVLRLTWHTKYACEKREDSGDDDSGNSGSGGWGFFTWFIIILFLGIASYLIFGSWLNYNRYGARGWDLVPHGDTIRDIPYLLKDWTRSVLNTVQGTGSRGGYSAV